MSDQSTNPFTTEAGLVDALNQIKAAINRALTTGNVTKYMERIEGILDRCLANQAEGSYPEILNRPEYYLIWYFWMKWTDFKEVPEGDEEVFWRRERAQAIANGYWTPLPAQPAPPQLPTARQAAPAAPIAGPSAQQKGVVRQHPAPSGLSSARPEKKIPTAQKMEIGAHKHLYPKTTAPTQSTTRLPSTIAADMRMKDAQQAPQVHTPTAALPKPVISQRPLPTTVNAVPSKSNASHRRPEPSAAAESSSRRQDVSAKPSGANALSKNMGRMSLTPSLSNVVAFNDMNDDSDEYIPSDEEHNEEHKERKRKRRQSAEDTHSKRQKMQENPQSLGTGQAEEMEEEDTAEVAGDDVIRLDQLDAMDTAPDGRKANRQVGIATKYVYVQPCRKCELKGKVCRVQAGQTGGKPAAACIPCNAAKIKCEGQGSELRPQAVVNEPDVTGKVIDGLVVASRKQQKKRRQVILDEDAPEEIAAAPKATNTPAPKPAAPKPVQKMPKAAANIIVLDSRSPSPKPQDAKRKPKKVADAGAQPTPDALSITQGLLMEMMAKKFNELAERLEDRFEEKFARLENGMVDLKTILLSAIMSEEQSTGSGGKSIIGTDHPTADNKNDPIPIPDLVVTAPTPIQSQQTSPADIEMDAVDEEEETTSPLEAIGESLPTEVPALPITNDDPKMPPATFTEDADADFGVSTRIIPAPSLHSSPGPEDNTTTPPTSVTENITMAPESAPLATSTPTTAENTTVAPETTTPTTAENATAAPEVAPISTSTPTAAENTTVTPEAAPLSTSTPLVSTDIAPAAREMTYRIIAKDKYGKDIDAPSTSAPSLAPPASSTSPPSLAPLASSTSAPSLVLSVSPLAPSSTLAPPDPLRARSRSRSRSVSVEPSRRSARLGSRSPSPLPPVAEK